MEANSHAGPKLRTITVNRTGAGTHFLTRNKDSKYNLARRPKRQALVLSEDLPNEHQGNWAVLCRTDPGLLEKATAKSSKEFWEEIEAWNREAGALSLLLLLLLLTQCIMDRGWEEWGYRIHFPHLIR